MFVIFYHFVSKNNSLSKTGFSPKNVLIASDLIESNNKQQGNDKNKTYTNA